MDENYIVSKDLMQFELHVDGQVKVKSLPNEFYTTDITTTLAETYQLAIHGYWLKRQNEDLVTLAVAYFEKKGFEVKEKDSSTDDVTNPQ